MPGFKYNLLPEQTYIIPVTDQNGNTQNIEILGLDILNIIEKFYLQKEMDPVSYEHE